MMDIYSRIERFVTNGDPEPAAFDLLALELFNFQFQNNTAYRSYCEACGRTPSNIRSCDDIPAVVTTAFKELDLTVVPPPERVVTFHSSGTTQHRPSRHFHSRQSLRIYEKSLTEWFRPNVIPGRSKANFLILSPPSTEAPHSSLVHMWETVARTFSSVGAQFCGRVERDGGWVVHLEQVRRGIEYFAKKDEPIVVCGTAFSFVELCDLLASGREDLALPPGSRVFETGGYKGRSRTVPKRELHELICRSFSVPETQIIGEYGMSELSSQAYDRKSGEESDRAFRFPPWVRTSIISPETMELVGEGETGLLRVMDLANVASVMAIQTEDLARKAGEGFELLGRATLAEARGCSLMHAHS